MYARRFSDVFSPAALIGQASLLARSTLCVYPMSKGHAIPHMRTHVSRGRRHPRIRLGVHSDSKGDGCTVTAQGSTRSHSEPGSQALFASVSVLWCESPWEQRSLCPSPFTSDLIPVSSIVPSAKRMDLGQVSEGALNGDRGA